MARMLDCYDIEGTRVWGVFQADVLAGAVSLSRHFHLQRLDVAFMWGLFVYQRYRGTAASRLLMEAAIDCCEHEQGIESVVRSEEHTSELQSLMRISYAVFC